MMAAHTNPYQMRSPDFMISIGVMEDGSFLGVLNRMLADGSTQCVVEHGESRAELIEWIGRVVKEPTKQ